MHIQLDLPDLHSIQTYTDDSLTINNQTYEKGLLVSQNEIVVDLPFKTISELSLDHMGLLAQFDPELIIVGRNDTGVFLSPLVVSTLAQQKVGIEAMSMGAACRTFNVLLSELRAVVGVFLF